MIKNIFEFEKNNKIIQKNTINKLFTKKNNDNNNVKGLNKNNMVIQQYILSKPLQINLCSKQNIKQNVKQNVICPTFKQHIICPDIKTIHNIFKLNFFNKVKASGFGDFLRGCYFLIQFCRENNFNYNFHIIEHPISNYLKYFHIKPTDLVPDNIHKLERNNYSYELNNNDNLIYSIDNNKINDFIDFVNSMSIYGGSVFINTNFCPKMPILSNDLFVIKNMLEPTQEIEDEINKHLSDLLLRKYNFSVIHIRMGDEYIVNDNAVDINNLSKLFKHINDLPNTIYLLITDCTIIKQYIIKLNPFLNIKYIINNITHTAENSTDESIKNTLIDFYMMSYSNCIYSFSVYSHGSGFSQWCATTYNIPYSCKFIG
jgi:hypothetical protein